MRLNSMEKITSASPLALSFIFKKITDPDPLRTGSIGVGCTINKKMEATAETAKKFSVYFNGEEIHFPTVYDAVRSITDIPLTIRFTSSLPLGYGFGLSGAGALSSLFSVNKLLHLNIPSQKLIQYAHISEIKNGTGLGTVGTESTGGFLVKTSAGNNFNYYSLPFAGKKLYVIIIDKLKSPDILNNARKLEKIESAGTQALNRIRNLTNPTLEEIIDISYEFVTEGCLLKDKRVNEMIEKIRQKNGHATMGILGNIVITTQNPDFPRPFLTQELTITDDKNF